MQRRISLLVYSVPSNDWIRPTYTGECSLLYLSTNLSEIHKKKNTHTKLPRIMFDEISGHLMAQSNEHIKLTITASKQKFSKEILF